LKKSVGGRSVRAGHGAFLFLLSIIADPI